MMQANDTHLEPEGRRKSDRVRPFHFEMMQAFKRRATRLIVVLRRLAAHWQFLYCKTVLTGKHYLSIVPVARACLSGYLECAV